MSLRTLFKNLTPKAHRPRKNTRRRPELDTLEAKTLLSGLVQGYVTGPAGAALAGAQVTLVASDPNNGSIHPEIYKETVPTTSPDGYYSFADVPAGHYTLSEAANGYATTGASFREMFNQNAAVSATAPKTISLDVVDLDKQTLTIKFGVDASTQSAYVWNSGISNWEGTSSGGYNVTYTTTDSNGVSTTTTLPANCMDPYHNVSPGQEYDVHVALQTLSNNPVKGGDATLGEVGWLSNHYGGPSANMSATDSSGLQLAIWALLKDGAPDLENSINASPNAAQDPATDFTDAIYVGGWGGVADMKLPLHVSADAAAIASANNFVMMAHGHSEHAYFLNSGQDIQGQLVGGDTQGQLVGGDTQGQGVFGDEYDFQNDVAPPPAAPTGPQLVQGCTATIGYWANKNGQALLQSYKTPDIGNFLAATCPNLFGNLTGENGTQVAAYFLKAKAAAKGAMNDYAQALCTALDVWATGSDPNGANGFTTAAKAQGFVQQKGIGTGGCLYNVGNNGAAFGVANGTTMTILDMLKGYDSLCVTKGSTTTSLPTSLTHTKGGLDAGGSTFDTINNTGDIA
jgi:hypothetical protein